MLVGLGQLRRLAVAAQGTQEERSTDTETDDRAESHHIYQGARDAEVIRQQRPRRTQEAKNIEPKRSLRLRQILAEADLKKEGSETDGGDDH